MNKRFYSLMLALALLLSCSALAEADLSGVADASQMTDVVDVVEAGMVPVAADQLADGVYEVVVDSSSSMFKIVGCELTVADGAITARLAMKSDAYAYLFPGTAEEAAAADEADLIPLEEEGDSFAFTFPVPALDAGVDCAAFSARKQVWYPRTLVFRADSLPGSAWLEAGSVTAESLALADGDYIVEVALEGGNGKTTLASPAPLTVKDGVCTAEIVFSTKKIDYVIVNDEKIEPFSTEDGAAFIVPVSAFDRKLAITVDSTAIKPATEVRYTMTFDSASLAAK